MNKNDIKPWSFYNLLIAQFRVGVIKLMTQWYKQCDWLKVFLSGLFIGPFYREVVSCITSLIRHFFTDVVFIYLSHTWISSYMDIYLLMWLLFTALLHGYLLTWISIYWYGFYSRLYYMDVYLHGYLFTDMALYSPLYHMDIYSKCVINN